MSEYFVTVGGKAAALMTEMMTELSTSSCDELVAEALILYREAKKTIVEKGKKFGALHPEKGKFDEITTSILRQARKAYRSPELIRAKRVARNKKFSFP